MMSEKKIEKMIDGRNAARYVNSPYEFNRWYYLHCTERLYNATLNPPSNNNNDNDACKFLSKEKRNTKYN